MKPNKFHDQALTALGKRPGEWHCITCWSSVSDLTSPEDVQKLRALARSLGASSDHEGKQGDRCKKQIEGDLLFGRDLGSRLRLGSRVRRL